MMCLGLDVATETGYCYGGHSDRPIYGVFKLPKLGGVEADSRALAGLYGGILALTRENEIEVTTVESPLPNIRRTNKRGITTLSSGRGRDILLMMYGVALAAVRNGGCPRIYTVEPSVWRKAVLGNGYPQDPKALAIDYCRLAFNCAVPNDNAADAVCIWQWTLGQAKLL